LLIFHFHPFVSVCESVNECVCISVCVARTGGGHTKLNKWRNVIILLRIHFSSLSISVPSSLRAPAGWRINVIISFHTLLLALFHILVPSQLAAAPRAYFHHLSSSETKRSSVFKRRTQTHTHTPVFFLPSLFTSPCMSLSSSSPREKNKLHLVHNSRARSQGGRKQTQYTHTGNDNKKASK
jgi:hypothetical protein